MHKPYLSSAGPIGSALLLAIAPGIAHAQDYASCAAGALFEGTDRSRQIQTGEARLRIGGHVQGFIIDFPAVYTHIKSGKLRGLALLGERRSPLVPKIDLCRCHPDPLRRSSEAFGKVYSSGGPRL